MTNKRLAEGVVFLTASDPDLQAVVDRHGLPPLWARPNSFDTLIRIILEQQVSLASGRAIHLRIEHALANLTPNTMVEAGAEHLRSLGVTRQKATYCVGVANHVLADTLNFRRLSRASDNEAREELQQIKGVGPWTADVYLLMALRRPDIWPVGDIALLTAFQHLRHLPSRPDNAWASHESLKWRPWRSVAARILWHGYLQGTLHPR